MTVRLQLMVPALTPGARRAVVGVDEGLDDAGRATALGLAHPWPDELYATSAPDRQCRETAALVGLNAEVDPRVCDWNLGVWAGRSLAEIAAASPHDLELWATDPDFAAHGGESLNQLRSRVTHWLDSLEAAGRPRLVTIAPTAVVRAILISVLDAPTSIFWRLDFEPLASAHISLRPGRRAIRWSDR